MVDDFKTAIKNGWRPKMEELVRIRDDANITWFPTEGFSVVPSNLGAVMLDKIDLQEAKQYNSRRINGEEKS